MLMRGAFRPEFTSLDQLAARPANLAEVNLILPGLVDNQLKFYRVAVDDSAPAPDDAPGRIQPVNFHASANPVLYVQC